MSWASLPPEIISRNLLLDDLDVHMLEARPSLLPQSSTPLVILLHGFPELSYSWRKVLVPLATAGYHVVAPDQRGYGRTRRRTTNIPPPVHDRVQFKDDLSPYRMLNLAKDIIALVYALGHKSAAAVIGHDCGARVAGYCSLIRPDMFKSVVMMSAAFTGAPTLPLGKPLHQSRLLSLNEQLGRLTPPRKHYTVYYSTPQANVDICGATQGLHSFLRAYYHVKSADWTKNQPHHLPSFSPSSFALLPNYYVMPLHETMAQVVSWDAPSPKEVEQNTWLTEEELAVYTAEFAATGLQGGLNWYRTLTDVRWSEDLMIFSGKHIEVPAMFIAGKQDWGVFQLPGAAEKMREKTCEKMLKEDFVLIEGVGHWVQQEAPEAVVENLLRFLNRVDKSSSAR